MRRAILELLREAAGKYLSGEDIAARLKVSRTAVWKHIKELKKSGYEIESLSRSGYRLVNTPDKLLPELVQCGLENDIIGRHIEYFDEVGSTNVEAKRLASRGAADGTLVIGECQNTGQGRLNRSFFCPRGGIWFSVILRPPFLPQEAPKCTLMAAVAVADAMRSLKLDAGIKWPNDVLCQGKKLVGILTEMSAEVDQINYVVIGIGINAVIPAQDFPADIRDRAASMSMLLGDFNRLDFFRQVLRNLEKLYKTVKAQGFAPLLTRWRELSVTLGKEVNVLGINEQFSGKAVDIADDGALLIDIGNEIKKVYAGDVSIRPKI